MYLELWVKWEAKSEQSFEMGRKIFAALVILGFLYVASPLIFPIAMGGVLAVLFSPWLERLQRKKLSAAFGSALLTFTITLVLILPASLLVFVVAKTGFSQLQSWRSSPGGDFGLFETVVDFPPIHRVMLWITQKMPMGMPELTESFQELAKSIGSFLAELLGGVATHLPGTLVSLIVVVVSIYFFLVDGKKLIQFVRSNSVFTPHQTDRLINTIAETCRSVVLASIVSGGVQAALEGVACMMVGVSNVALIGLLVFISSFIPVVGALPVTLSVALWQFADGRQAEGVILLVMVFVILGIDNTVRPLFLKGTANLHPLLAFVAAFGGLQVMGFLGVFLGPVLAALFVTTVEILTRPSEGPLPPA